MRLDNENGDPIFQPELTGDGLRGQDLADWIDFCEAIVADPETAKYYGVWFENHWARASEKRGGSGKTRAQSTVKAEVHDGVIYIRCPTKVWADLLSDAMRQLRRLSRREFKVLAPGERPVTREGPILPPEKLARLKAEIKQCENGGPLQRSLAGLGKKILERHERAVGEGG